MAESDSTDPPLRAANSGSATPPVAGRWTHLVGVYDGASKRLSLYVNGVLQATTATMTTGFNGQSGLAIGRQKYNDAFGDSFNGMIADVRVWNRAVVAEDFTGSAVLDEPGMFAPVEVGRYAMEAGFEDSGPWVRDLTPTAEDWGFVESGRVGFGLQLNLDEWNTSADGKTGSASAAGPAVRTDGPFTVSAWVKLADNTVSRAAVVQDGVVRRGFGLGYSRTTDRWALTMAASDSTAGSLIEADSVNAPTLNAWVHLTGVYDPNTGMRLYVNGVRQGTNASMPGWHATGPLRVGRSMFNGTATDFWFGDVDEVRIFAGAMTDAQVTELYHEF
jgi:hypothetical protein